MPSKKADFYMPCLKSDSKKRTLRKSMDLKKEENSSLDNSALKRKKI
jgi:hypothetical protein